MELFLQGRVTTGKIGGFKLHQNLGTKKFLK